jgi:hypothetical protein
MCKRFLPLTTFAPAITITIALALPATALPAQERAIQIPRIERAPDFEEIIRLTREPAGSSVDGNGSAAAPDLGAMVGDFRQREPGDGVPVSQGTTAYLSYDDTNLYVVFACKDDPARIRANIARREDIGDDDQVAVYLDTFRDRKRAYSFVVNPLGVQRDGILTEGIGEDMSFDAVWRSEGRILDDGYVVRLTIPFRSLRFPGDSAQTWGIALQRVIQRANEEAYWPEVTKRVKGMVPQFGTASGLVQVTPGRSVQVNPYSVVARARVLDDDIADHVRQGDERIGMDLKAVIRSAFTLDATVNPDFSQVETDDPQVTVNQRFEVFFPEKRPFFLENSDYFQTPVNLFFSRRVVDPGAGVRLTGKSGRWAIGTVAMNDRAALPAGEPAAGRDTWISALRLQRDLGEESTIGLLVTDREFIGSPKSDRIFAIDGRWRAGDNWSFSSQVMRSANREDDGVGSADWGVLGDLSFESRNFSYGAKYQQLGPQFAAPLGFVSRVGYRRTEHDAEFTFRPEDSPVTGFGPAFALDVYWDHQTGRLLDREIEALFQMELEGDTEIEIGRVQAFEFFDDLEFRPHATQATFSTDFLRWLGAEASYAWGTAVNHDPADGLLPTLERAEEAEAGITIRPTPQLRFEQAVTHARLHTAGGSTIVAERNLRSKLNYQFSPRLSLRAIVDWERTAADTTRSDEDALEREVGMDLLLTWLAHPGTAIYVGYTDSYENLRILPGSPPTIEPSTRPGLSVGRQFFVKASYLLRF